MLNDSQITAIQSALAAQGFLLAHEPNGIWTPETQHAYEGWGARNNVSRYFRQRQPESYEQVPEGLRTTEQDNLAAEAARQLEAERLAAEAKRIADEAEAARLEQVRLAEEEAARNAQLNNKNEDSEDKGEGENKGEGEDKGEDKGAESNG